MHTKIFSATTIGINAYLVDVEVDLAFGLIDFQIVGLADTAIKESRQRVITALKNSGFKSIEKKIIVNLAPAHLKKEGTLFDLPIALGILQAAKLINIDHSFLQETIIIGELSLDGSIKPIKGALAIACDSAKLNKKRIILPAANAQEASLIKDIEVIGATTLQELIHFFSGAKNIAPTAHNYKALINQKNNDAAVDFADVKGQHWAKRALQIAAAGRHNILFSGPPGSGKTMLARRLISIMPDMAFEEIIESTKIYSISGKLESNHLITKRPFRSPHHSVSTAGLIGGGTFPKPGEVSLAHHGILFLDELTEFKRETIEALRQPLESQTAEIARVQQSIKYPAAFLLVAALNPCPCGFLADQTKTCICSAAQIQKYQSKISGPLLDRIDIKVSVQAVSFQDATTTVTKDCVSSESLKIGVTQALVIQRKRFNNSLKTNSMMNTADIQEFCILTPQAQATMEKAFTRMQLSMRSYHKILKLARTIADIANSKQIEHEHIQEAIMYKS